MDLRQWLLLSDRPAAVDLGPYTHHVPCSEFRSTNVLRLFLAGFQTGFKLTDADGQPTEALRLMVAMMRGKKPDGEPYMDIELVTGAQLPHNVKRAFGKDDKALVEVLTTSWYLTGLTGRIKNAFSSLNTWQHQWVWGFLPGLDSARVTYEDPDGKRRRRICYIAKCQLEWGMDDRVYEGLWRWTYGHYYKWHDAYSIVRAIQAAEAEGDPAGGSHPAEAVGAAS